MRVYIITHGKRFENADPDMTPIGYQQIEALRPKLPKEPTQVVVGTGRRQKSVAKAAGLTATRYSAAVGGPEALVQIGVEDFIVQADGTMVPFAMDTSDHDLGPSVAELVLSLPHDSVICGGRGPVISLGIPLAESRSGAVYVVEHDGKTIESLTLME